MKFELDFFEIFIQRELKAKRGSNSVIPDFARKTKEIFSEVDRIKKGLRSQLFLIENENRLELLIQHHQVHVVSLADRVLKLFTGKRQSVLTKSRRAIRNLTCAKFFTGPLKNCSPRLKTIFLNTLTSIVKFRCVMQLFLSKTSR